MRLVSVVVALVGGVLQRHTGTGELRAVWVTLGAETEAVSAAVTLGAIQAADEGQR